jgi:hypothetical protein
MRDGVIPHPHHVIDRAPGCANIGFAERAPVRPINTRHIEPGLTVPASTTAPASPPTLAYHPIRSTIERNDTLNRHLGLTERHAFVGWTARFPPRAPMGSRQGWERCRHHGRLSDTRHADHRGRVAVDDHGHRRGNTSYASCEMQWNQSHLSVSLTVADVVRQHWLRAGVIRPTSPVCACQTAPAAPCDVIGFSHCTGFPLGRWTE